MIRKQRKAATAISTAAWFSTLKWIDGRPLLDTIEPYRRRLFEAAFDTKLPDGRPVYNLVLAGRGKKNWKSADLVLAGLYCLVARREAYQGNDGLILGNDEAQAGDDLALAKKLVNINLPLAAELEIRVKEIVRRDGNGTLRILPARDVVGLHGKTAEFIGYDEVHGLKDWNLFEALQPDPTRTDTLQWVTSYDTIFNVPGVPLYDLKKRGIEGSDSRMLFSWYSGDLCTDVDFAELEPELRANPSIGSWPEGMAYLEQQKLRLPSHKYRRLHLNLPGSPEGSFFDQAMILAAVVPGRKMLPFQEGIAYRSFVDMSGGSNDDAVLAITHLDGKRVIVDRLEKQVGPAPFDPRKAVKHFAAILQEYNLSTVKGDHYAGETFKRDFESYGITYKGDSRSASDLYEALEPRLNANEVELLDHPASIEQLICLVMRGAKITHQHGDHDDFACAIAGAVDIASRGERPRIMAVSVPTLGSSIRRYY